jgi:hypothetical protein
MAVDNIDQVSESLLKCVLFVERRGNRAERMNNFDCMVVFVHFVIQMDEAQDRHVVVSK